MSPRDFAILSIRRPYAQAILDGTKRVEFRTRSIDLRRPGGTVFIYETAPTKAVVGEFVLEGLRCRRPAELWEEFGPVGGIDKAAYDAYYEGREFACGLIIGQVTRFTHPAPIQFSAPQSYRYVDAGGAAQIRDFAVNGTFSDIFTRGCTEKCWTPVPCPTCSDPLPPRGRSVGDEVGIMDCCDTARMDPDVNRRHLWSVHDAVRWYTDAPGWAAHVAECTTGECAL